MTPRFLSFVPFILRWEGGYDRDPDDPGNYVNGVLKGTNFGIDARSHPDVDIKNLTKEGATAIYWQEWQGNQCESLPVGIGEVYFNACVNCGRGRAEKCMTGSKYPHGAKEFLDEQDAFYERLAAARPSSAKYLKGWKNRTADLRKVLDL